MIDAFRQTSASLSTTARLSEKVHVKLDETLEQQLSANEVKVNKHVFCEIYFNVRFLLAS